MTATLQEHRPSSGGRPDSSGIAGTVGGPHCTSAERPRQPVDSLSPRARLNTGVWLEKEGRLKEAAACFQSAIACAPVHMGVTEWFTSYLLDGQPVARDSAEVVEQAYESLARVLRSLGRARDAACAEDAARRLRPNHVGAAPLSRTGDDSDCDSALHDALPSRPGGRVRTDTARSLTVLMVTHYTGKLNRYAHLAPPDTGLVAATYDSAVEVLGKGIEHCPKLLVYDGKPDGGDEPKRTEYGRRLERFAREGGFALRCTQGVGLLKALDSAIREVKTPLILFLEHDWQFVGPAVNLDRLVEVFETHPYVHSIRFNKRCNRVSNYDFLLEHEDRIGTADLLRTPAVSNNPNLVRVGTLRSLWLPTCLADPVVRNSDLAGHPFGVEEPLFKHQMRDVRAMGFSRAHARWGTYLHGRMNTPARIRHLGE